MDPDHPHDAHAVVSAYTTVLERHFSSHRPSPAPLSALPYAKPVIKRSIRTTAVALADADQMTDELRGFLEVAYTSLADYVDDELARVMAEYREAMAAVEASGEFGRGKTGTAGWQRLADTSALVSRIARAIADEAEALRVEFQEFGAVTVART